MSLTAKFGGVQLGEGGHVKELIATGADAAMDLYAEAGIGFADDVMERLLR